MQIVQDIVGSILMVLVVGKLYEIPLCFELVTDNCIKSSSSWLQDKVISTNRSRSLNSPQSLPQLLVDNSIIQAIERFPQVRFLPNTLRNRWSSNDCQFGTWRCFHG